MCKDKMCPLHESCYRYNAIPNEHIQYYGHFQYDKYKQCEYYIPTSPRPNDVWYCSGCGETDRNKRCLGCRTSV